MKNIYYLGGKEGIVDNKCSSFFVLFNKVN